MKWRVGLPNTPGWYWFRNLAYKDEAEPRIVLTRIYCDDLAIQNTKLSGWDRFEQGEWAGPIPLPEEAQA